MAIFIHWNKYLENGYTPNYTASLNGIAYPYKYGDKEYDITNYATDNNSISYGYANTAMVGRNWGVGRIIQSNDAFSQGIVITDTKHKVYGYPFMSITSNERIEDTLNIIVPSSTISGKYRFKSHIYWYEYWSSLYDSTISVNLQINGVKNRAIIFCSNKQWVRTTSPFYGKPSKLFIQTYNEYGIGRNAPSDLFGDYTIDGAELTDEYKNMIWDFGDLPQEVPQAFVDWLNNNADIIYDNSFIVKNQNGTEEFARVNEAPNIIKETLNVIGNEKTLNLYGSNDKIYTLIWESYTPADKIFLGLSVAPNSSAPLIPVGKEVSVSFNDSTTFYEIYAKYKPLSTKFEIHTYKSSAEQNRVDKTNFLTADMIISGVLREASSLIHPSITFTSDIIPTFNYVYIPIFNRYYYVTDITSIKNKLWQMSLTVDVLMTYKEALLACTGYIDRNENEYNGLIPDGMISLQKGEIIETNFVTNEVFTESEGTYILQGLLVSVGDVVTDTHTGSSGDEHSGGGGNFGN